jgi:hypothetical protein
MASARTARPARPEPAPPPCLATAPGRPTPYVNPIYVAARQSRPRMVGSARAAPPAAWRRAKRARRISSAAMGRASASMTSARAIALPRRSVHPGSAAVAKVSVPAGPRSVWRREARARTIAIAVMVRATARAGIAPAPVWQSAGIAPRTGLAAPDCAGVARVVTRTACQTRSRVRPTPTAVPAPVVTASVCQLDVGGDAGDKMHVRRTRRSGSCSGGDRLGATQIPTAGRVAPSRGVLVPLAITVVPAPTRPARRLRVRRSPR